MIGVTNNAAWDNVKSEQVSIEPLLFFFCFSFAKFKCNRLISPCCLYVHFFRVTSHTSIWSKVHKCSFHSLQSTWTYLSEKSTNSCVIAPSLCMLQRSNLTTFTHLRNRYNTLAVNEQKSVYAYFTQVLWTHILLVCQTFVRNRRDEVAFHNCSRKDTFYLSHFATHWYTNM